MSDSSIPQKPPFEETEAYKILIREYQVDMRDMAIHHTREKEDLENEFEKKRAKLHHRYDRGEL